MTTLSASDIAGRRIREARKRRGWTVRDLAGKCAEAGVPRITAPVITNLETRRRAGREVSAEELVALAWVLEVPPVQLLSPLDGDEVLEIVPGEDKDPVAAAAWLSDDDYSLGAARMATSTRPDETERVLRYRDSPLAMIRAVRGVVSSILFHERLNAAGEDRPYEGSFPVLGVRLLHLLASLEALGYSRPPLDEVMGILAKHGVPASLAELDDDGEMPDGEGS
jgi:transcriptional regulator with XRE-family HTH domain